MSSPPLTPVASSPPRWIETLATQPDPDDEFTWAELNAFQTRLHGISESPHLSPILESKSEEMTVPTQAATAEFVALALRMIDMLYKFGVPLEALAMERRYKKVLRALELQQYVYDHQGAPRDNEYKAGFDAIAMRSLASF